MLLALLSTATQHNHQVFSFFSEVDPVTGPEVDLNSKHTRTDTLDVREISGGKPSQGGCHFGRGLRIQTSEPIREGTATVGRKILPNFDHALW